MSDNTAVVLILLIIALAMIILAGFQTRAIQINIGKRRD